MVFMQRIRQLVHTIKAEAEIYKYTRLVTRLIECMEEENWSFSEAAEYLMCTQKEFYDCIEILRLKRTGSVEKAVNAYILKKEEPE